MLVTHIYTLGNLNPQQQQAQFEILKPNERSARDLDGFGLRRLGFRLLRHCHSQHPVFHARLDLFHLCILRQPETPKELSAGSLNTVPFVVLVLFFFAALPAYLENSLALFQFYFHIFFLQTWKISLENMRLRRFLPYSSAIEWGEVAFGPSPSKKKKSKCVCSTGRSLFPVVGKNIIFLARSRDVRFGGCREGAWSSIWAKTINEWVAKSWSNAPICLPSIKILAKSWIIFFQYYLYILQTLIYAGNYAEEET
jgi:hypothetical protein